MDNLIISPIGIVPKKAKDEYRLIHHLSHPHGNSDNDFIDPNLCTVHYSSMDDAIPLIQRLGPHVFLAKADIKSAFRLCLVAPQDFSLLGIKFNEKYYVDKALPMGCSISCSIFEKLSTFLEWAVRNRNSSRCTQSDLMHYLDDFLFVGASELQCQAMLSTFLDTASDLGIPIASEKTALPCTTIAFLGFQLDTVKQQLLIPPSKIAEAKFKLNAIILRCKVTRKQLESVLWLLTFFCRAIPIGRAFLRRVIDATWSVRLSYHNIRVTKAITDDPETWLDFLQNYMYNGISVFLDRFWTSSSALQLFTDSAGGIDKGFGAYFDGNWTSAIWPYQKHHFAGVFPNLYCSIYLGQTADW